MIQWQGETLKQVEREVLVQAFEHFSGKRVDVARALDVSVRTIANKMDEYPELRSIGKAPSVEQV